MRWLLENPGYEVDDRRDEVVGDILEYEVPYLTDSATLITIHRVVAECASRPESSGEFSLLEKELGEARMSMGIFWEDSAPEYRSKNRPHQWVFSKISSRQLGEYHASGGYSTGVFPVALSDRDYRLVRKAADFCAGAEDQWEMQIFVSATHDELLALAHTLGNAGLY